MNMRKRITIYYVQIRQVQGKFYANIEKEVDL